MEILLIILLVYSVIMTFLCILGDIGNRKLRKEVEALSVLRANDLASYTSMMDELNSGRNRIPVQLGNRDYLIFADSTIQEAYEALRAVPVSNVTYEDGNVIKVTWHDGLAVAHHNLTLSFKDFKLNAIVTP